jgi:hypothetical protein
MELKFNTNMEEVYQTQELTEEKEEPMPVLFVKDEPLDLWDVSEPLVISEDGEISKQLKN